MTMESVASSAVELINVIQTIRAATALEAMNVELTMLVLLDRKTYREVMSRYPDPITGDQLRGDTNCYRPPPT